MSCEVLALTEELINRQSVTPEDAGCQQLMAEYLAPLGFEIETMVFEDTTNMWARKGKGDPVFCFATPMLCPVGLQKSGRFRHLRRLSTKDSYTDAALLI
mgnify:CR=1 FL=1